MPQESIGSSPTNFSLSILVGLASLSDKLKFVGQSTNWDENFQLLMLFFMNRSSDFSAA